MSTTTSAAARTESEFNLLDLLKYLLSKWPWFVMAGDVVVLERRASYETDDIVLAMTDHGVMLHAMMPDGRVMGTANVQRRERVVMVAGKVTSVERGGKVRSTEGRGWRMMMAAWRVCLPVRRVLMKIVNMRER